MKNKLIHIIGIPVTAYLFWNYLQGWIGRYIDYFWMKPFVYRVLVPIMAKGMSWFGIPETIAYIVILSLVMVGIIILSKKFYDLWRQDENGWFISYVGSWVLIVLLYKYPKYYDLMEVLLMLSAFYFLAKSQHFYFILLFPFMCLNKETSILITLFSAVWFWRKMKLSYWIYLLMYQGMIFVLVQAGIRYFYQDYAGTGSGFHLLDNFYYWSQYPILTCILFLGFGLLVYFSLRGQKPEFLKTAFVTIFPALFLLYVVLGYHYEVRVFSELYPIVLVLIPYQEKSHATQIQKIAEMSNYEKDHVPHSVWSKSSHDENMVTRFKL